MTTKTTISITEARRRIFDIADDVTKTSARYTLTEKGRPKVVIMSAEEHESWLETLEVMNDIPDLKKDIKDFERDMSSGAYKSYPTLEEVLAKQGFIMTAKAKKKYEVSPKPQAKGRKRAKRSS